MNSASAPLVSAVIPVFDAEAFLRETVQSVLNQTLGDFEVLLIVDERANEASKHLARELSVEDPRVFTIDGPAGGGVSANRNRGIERARGRYVAFLDADDLWEPRKLEVQIDLMEKEYADLSYHSYRWMSEAGEPLPTVREANRPLRGNDLMAVNPIGCFTAVVRKDRLAGTRFENVSNEDWLFWHRLVKERGLTALPVPDILGRYRLVANSRSARKFSMARSRWTHYRRTLGLGILPSLRYFLQYTLESLTLRLLGARAR